MLRAQAEQLEADGGRLVGETPIKGEVARDGARTRHVGHIGRRAMRIHC